MKGKLQYRFKGNSVERERNIVLEFNSNWQLLKAVWKSLKLKADAIFVYFEK